MNISCCMIVRNEQDVLDTTLKTASKIFDELIVVDTGSTDNTIFIAKEYTQNVFKCNWEKDFSQARNYSIARAKNDWVFILDADENITLFNKDQIESVIVDEADIGRIKIRNEIDSGLVSIERVSRMFNSRIFHFEGKIHEQIKPTKGFVKNLKDIEVSIDHIGYKNQIINKKNKTQRNIELLKEEISSNSSDPFLYYQLGKVYSLNNELELTQGSFEKALRLNLNYDNEYVVDLIFSYGYTLLKRNLFKEALIMEKYLTVYGNQADYCFLMGLIYMNNALFKKSLSWFGRCLELKEGYIEGINSFLPCYNIGVIYECLGFNQEAKEWYKKCKGYTLAEKRYEFLKGKCK